MQHDNAMYLPRNVSIHCHSLPLHIQQALSRGHRCGHFPSRILNIFKQFHFFSGFGSPWTLPTYFLLWLILLPLLPLWLVKGLSLMPSFEALLEESLRSLFIFWIRSDIFCSILEPIESLTFLVKAIFSFSPILGTDFARSYFFKSSL